MFHVHFRGELDTLSYVVALDRGRDAIVIDPTEDCLEAYVALCRRLGYRLRYCLETGAVSASAKAAGRLAEQVGCRRIVPCDAFTAGPVVRVGHGDHLDLAGLVVEVIGRPGRVQREVSYRIDDRVFVGASEVRAHPQLRALPVDTLVYRAVEHRGTHLGLLGLEVGASASERARWRAAGLPPA